MGVTTEVNRRDAITLIAGVTTGLLFPVSETCAEIKQIPSSKFDYDVVIVGGGPSGLSAALVLGRCCRKVLVCDEGKPRNHTSPAVHGFFSRDGISPAELLKVGREQLKPYNVELQDTRADNVEKLDSGFRLALANGKSITTRKLILATGVKDELLDIDGLPALWGTGVFHCPYCHGWEVRHKPWAFIASGEQAVAWGSELQGWTTDLTFCSNGPSELTDADRDKLKKLGINVREESIERLDSENGELKAVEFKGGDKLEIDAMFIRTALSQRSAIPKQLGCKLSSIEGMFTDVVETNQFGATSVSGLYVIGDASLGAPQVSTAVSDGSMAAIMVNKMLLKEGDESLGK